MRLLLAGGGTGGHVFPAVALADRLRETTPAAEILFVGTRRGLEAKVIPQLGYSLETVDISGWMGKGLRGKISVAPQLLLSIWQSRRILRTFRPDVVVGVGGYASAPVLMAARLAGLPVLIHEQNAWPGLTNRLLSRWADRVCLSFADADCAFHRGRTVLTGNPLRQGMENCPPLPAGDPRLLVFGGSRGARAINETMVAALPHLTSLQGKLRIRHQTGEGDLQATREGYRRAGWDPSGVEPFIDDMASAYANAHLVLCRAGATTIAELTACGRPAILIPYPHAAADHQSANARSLARRGAGLMLPQQDLTPELLAKLVGDLLVDRERLEMMGKVAHSMALRGAADRILAECRAIMRNGKNLAQSTNLSPY
jgi:UDP-N-acetylglucosamine--N-acetylmuramyl-(pentapeptide) pyrophosphoryl-undecaprenol N-acetylglucosamine transferase